MSNYVAPTAQFYPAASLRVTDITLYNQIKSDYNLGLGTPDPAGSNIIVGISPVALGTQYSVNWVNNPTTADYSNLPAVFTVAAQSVVNGTTITPDGTQNGVQTLASSYTDPNGQTFSTVTWAWQVEVVFLTVAGLGQYDQEIVTWTGDGTANRLIPTSFALDSGVVAIWGVGGANGNGTGDANFFRHNGSMMTGTAVAGIGSNPLADGIVDFVAGGFHVSAGASSLTYANTSGVSYVAVVCKDSTFDNRYMRVGSYVGLGSSALSVLATHGSSVVNYFSGIVFDPSMSGIQVTDGSANTYIFTYVSSTVGSISPAYIPATSNPVTLTFAGGTRTVNAPSAGTANPVALTHVWVWGSGVCYKSTDIPSTTSVDLQAGASGSVPVTTMITGFTATDGFTVVDAAGANQSVNTNNRKYNFMAFVGGDTVFQGLNVFTSGQATTPGSLPKVVSGLPFTPTLVFGRQGNSSGFTDGGIFRGPTHTGTSSTRVSIPGGNNNVPTTGIVAIGANAISFQSAIAQTTGQPFWWWGFQAGDGGAPISPPTWVLTTPLDLGTGTTSDIETTQVSQTSPGDGWVNAGFDPTFQWWCYPAFGLSVYQIDSPGSGWVACAGPATANGWYLSTAGFGNQDTIVSGGRPADPRSWAKLSTWCAIGNMAVYGGAPAAGCNINNHMVYPASGYTVGTDYPPIRVFDGRSDKELCRLPPTTANVIPKAVMSMLAANGTVYLTTWDSGTSSSDWNGRVMQLDPETGVLTPLGVKFANGEMPYALCWHMGRLWCGTNNSIGTVGKVYYFRPGIDTAWTQDYATSSSSAGGVTSMASYKGILYVGTDNAAGSRGKVLARDTAGAYTTSQTGSGGTAKVNNGYLALTVLGANLYASYWNNDTTPISKIEKYTGSAWSTAYTGTGSTLVPYILLQLDNAEIYAVGGSQPYDAVLLVTSDGTTWTDLTAELPVETATLLPMFGAVVT